MSTVLRTTRARIDLRELWLHIAKDKTSAADRFLQTIDEKCRMLAKHPEMGQWRPELAPNLRSFPVGNYIIFYRPIDGGIEVVRLISGSRDIDALF